jgi:PST family polysaccharide transporter
MFLGFMLMTALVAIFPVFEHDWLLYCLMYLTVVGNVLFPVWLYQGLGHMRHIAAFTIIARSLMVIAVFVFVTNAADYALAAGLLSAGMLMAGLIALIFIPRLVKIRFCWPGFSRLMKDFLSGWHIFVAMMGGSVYNNSNIFILGLVASPAMVGYFAAADKLIKAVQGIIQPVSQAVYPYIATLIARSKDEALTFIGKLLRIIGGGMLGISIALFLLAAPITEVLFGVKFDQSIHLIELMALVPFLIGLNNVFGAQFLVQFDLGRLLSFSIILPALVHVAVLYFIATTWGASGVALLMIFTELFVLGIRVVGLLGKHKPMLWHVLLARKPKAKNV